MLAAWNLAKSVFIFQHHAGLLKERETNTTTTQISNKKYCKFSSLWAVFMTIGQLCTSIETPMRHNRQEISNLFGKKKWWESKLLASLISGFSVFEIRPVPLYKIIKNCQMIIWRKWKNSWFHSHSFNPFHGLGFGYPTIIASLQPL